MPAAMPIPDQLETRSFALGHLPLIRAAIQELGLVDVINQLSPKHPLAQVSDGECLVVMLFNILAGRTALWRMDEWAERLDVGLLLGEGVEAASFHDHRLGQFLDHLFEVGTDNILSEVVGRYLQKTSTGAFSVHLDSTTLAVEGAYDGAGEPRPAHGHSKDLRPDLKQLLFGLSIRGDIGIPLTMSVASGNTSDTKNNRDHIAQLAALLPKPDEVTVVADCKLMDAQTLGDLIHAGLHFVTLVPRNFGIRDELVDKALLEDADVERWPTLATRAGARQADPPVLYRGRSFVGKTAVSLHEGPRSAKSDSKGEGRVTHSHELRFLVVHSDQLRTSFDDSIANKVDKEKDKLSRKIMKLAQEGFACAEDALQAANAVVKGSTYLNAEVSVERRETPLKREKAGRPKAGEERPTSVTWHPRATFEENKENIDRERKHNSCFVLVTDWFSEDWSDERVLAEYRHQSIVEGQTGFRWLKGPTVASPLFLHTPSRIQALGLVMVLALMLRNHMQHRLRSQAEATQQPPEHPFRSKPDARLTLEMAFVWFDMVTTTLIRMGPDQPWVRTRPHLKPEAQHIMRLLGTAAEVFHVQPARWALGRYIDLSLMAD